MLLIFIRNEQFWARIVPFAKVLQFGMVNKSASRGALTPTGSMIERNHRMNIYYVIPLKNLTDGVKEQAVLLGLNYIINEYRKNGKDIVTYPPKNGSKKAKSFGGTNNA
jgi:hypothetical protein